MRGWISGGLLLAATSFAAGGDAPADPVADARALAKECEARPDDIAARLRLGEAWLVAHDAAAADRAFEAVLAKSPDNAAAHFGRGRAAQDEGKWDEAARSYARAVEKDPLWEPARTRLALVYALYNGSSEKPLDAAIDEALALPAQAQDPVLWEYAVHRALDRREPGLAVERAKELIRRFPDSPWGPSVLGWAYFRQGKDSEAAEAYGAGARLRKSLTWPPQRTKLALPFEGRWVVLQGPGGSHSHMSNRNAYAWDFQALDQLGHTYAEKGRRNEDYFCFGKSVLAPADGWVVETWDGVPDNEPGQSNPAKSNGNHVIIEHAPGEYSRFFHLKNGSVAVKPGRKVARGEVLGRCGNSGNSMEPHLHFDLCSARPPADASRPSVFERYVRIRQWQPLDVADGCPESEQWIEPFKRD